MFIVFTASITSINSTMGSAIAANLILYLQAEWNVPSGPQTILPASIFLIGFLPGPLIFAPLSESYGRRPVVITAFGLYIVASIACALAPNWPVFLFFRFLAGTFAAPPLSVMGGLIADVYDDETTRGRAMVVWSGATIIGALTAPIISGFTAQYGWRRPIWQVVYFLRYSADQWMTS